MKINETLLTSLFLTRELITFAFLNFDSWILFLPSPLTAFLVNQYGLARDPYHHQNGKPEPFTSLLYHRTAHTCRHHSCQAKHNKAAQSQLINWGKRDFLTGRSCFISKVAPFMHMRFYVDNLFIIDNIGHK